MKKQEFPLTAGFATKPTLAAGLIDRAVEAKVPAAWVAGDEVYVPDPKLLITTRHTITSLLAWATPATKTPIPSPAIPLATAGKPMIMNCGLQY